MAFWWMLVAWLRAAYMLICERLLALLKSTILEKWDSNFLTFFYSFKIHGLSATRLVYLCILKSEQV